MKEHAQWLTKVAEGAVLNHDITKEVLRVHDAYGSFNGPTLETAFDEKYYEILGVRFGSPQTRYDETLEDDITFTNVWLYYIDKTRTDNHGSYQSSFRVSLKDFGKSEEEIKQWKKDYDKRRKEKSDKEDELHKVENKERKKENLIRLMKENPEIVKEYTKSARRLS